MIKKLANRKKWYSTSCGVYSSNVAVQGFDTSVKSMLLGHVTDEGSFNNMVGTEDGETVPQLYNDALDFPAQAQYDYAAQVNEAHKRITEYYKHDSNDFVEHTSNSDDITTSETSAPPENS